MGSHTWQPSDDGFQQPHMGSTQTIYRDIFIKSPKGGGHLRFWTFSKTNFRPFFNKRCKIVDLSLWCVIQRSRNFTKHSKLWTFFYAAWLRGSAFF